MLLCLLGTICRPSVKLLSVINGNQPIKRPLKQSKGFPDHLLEAGLTRERHRKRGQFNKHSDIGKVKG